VVREYQRVIALDLRLGEGVRTIDRDRRRRRASFDTSQTLPRSHQVNAMHMLRSKDNQNVQRSLRSGTPRLNGGSGGSATRVREVSSRKERVSDASNGRFPPVCVRQDKTVPPDLRIYTLEISTVTILFPIPNARLNPDRSKSHNHLW
jgi:hypothetical protein